MKASTLTLQPSSPRNHPPKTWGTLRLSSPLASPTTSSAPIPSSLGSSFDDAFSSRPTNKQPLVYEGSLEEFEYEESTPAIGREYTADLQLSEILESDDSEKIIKDLAVLGAPPLPHCAFLAPCTDSRFRYSALAVARRGVVFFRSQNITAVQMTKLGLALGRLSGGPAASGLHIHPLTDDSPELPVVAEISSDKQNKGGGLRGVHDDRSRFASQSWHSDVTFEVVTSSFVRLSFLG